MGRGVTVFAAALGLALAGASSSHEAQGPARASLARDGTVRINGVPQFLIGVGWPTPAQVPRALTLGIGILQGNGPGATQLAISQAVGSKGWIVPAVLAEAAATRTTGTRSATRSLTSPTGTGYCPRPPTLTRASASPTPNARARRAF